VHLLFEAHESYTHPFYFSVAQRSPLHPPDRLALEQLPKELNERQDELRESRTRTLGIDVDPLGQERTKAIDIAAKGCDLVSWCFGRHESAKVYGGQGPLTTARTPPSPEATLTTLSFSASASPAGARMAVDSATLADGQ